jgi:transposase InsO family protein
MNMHKNARLMPQGRLLLVQRVIEQGWTVRSAAGAAGLSQRQAYRWLARYRDGGTAALVDRSSAPQQRPHQVPDVRVAEIERRRRQRLSGPAIARQLAMPVSTVGGILRRLGLGKLSALEPKPPVVRYQRERPGELIHIDTKKLGRIEAVGHRITGDRRDSKRGAGWEAVHVCIDDASRLAYSEVLADERKTNAVPFLERAVGWFARQGITVERVMTDNGSAYRSGHWGEACGGLGLRHIRTRPYTPRTNGKAERFIQTALREWAYAKPYRSSAQRAGALGPFLTCYNTTRPHTAHGRRPPISRLSA